MDFCGHEYNESSNDRYKMDARIIARDISLGAIEYAEYWDVIVPKIIMQFAQYYHSSTCANCKK